MAVDHAAGDPHSGSGRSVGDPPPLWMPRIRQVYVLGGEVRQIPPPPNDPPSFGSGVRLWAPEVILRKAASHVGQGPKATHRETKSEARRVVERPAARGEWNCWGPQRLLCGWLTQ